MTSARHKAVVEHTSRRRVRRVVVPALAAMTLTGSVVGVALAGPGGDDPAPQADRPVAQSVGRVVLADRVEALEDRRQSVSRAARRVTLEEKPVAVAKRFATAPLKVRTEPAEDSRHVAVIDELAKVAITGETQGDFAEIVYDGEAYWVSAEYLVKEKPEPEPEADPTADAATTDSGTEPVGTCTATPPSGVSSGAMAVFEAVCSRFPSITTYGGWRGDGEHSDGNAIDVMVSGDLGWQVAEYLRANASAFNLYDVIYSQKIFTQERASEGWRPMEDRGSTTANHYDHVHVAVY